MGVPQMVASLRWMSAPASTRSVTISSVPPSQALCRTELYCFAIRVHICVHGYEVFSNLVVLSPDGFQ